MNVFNFDIKTMSKARWIKNHLQPFKKVKDKKYKLLMNFCGKKTPGEILKTLIDETDSAITEFGAFNIDQALKEIREVVKLLAENDGTGLMVIKLDDVLKVLGGGE